MAEYVPAHESEGLLPLDLCALRRHLLLLVSQRLLHEHHFYALLHSVLLRARHSLRLLRRQSRQRAPQDGRQRRTFRTWTCTRDSYYWHRANRIVPSLSIRPILTCEHVSHLPQVVNGSPGVATCKTTDRDERGLSGRNPSCRSNRGLVHALGHAACHASPLQRTTLARGNSNAIVME